MSEKTYVFGDTGANSGMLSLLGPLMQQRGIDPNVLLAMRNNDGYGEGSWFIWILFLLVFAGGWGNGGFGGNANNAYGANCLLSAIDGNGDAINQLAATLHCDVNQIQTALCSLQSNIQSVGSQVGLSGQQIINAIQSGNCTIANQLATCCCDVKNLVTTQGYENRIASSENTAAIISKIDNQTTLINDKFCQLEMREMQSKIDTLRDEKLALQNNISQRAQNEYIASSLYPITTALTELRADFDCFKSHLPETVTVRKENGVYVPYNPVTAIPNCVAAQYGFGPYANCGGYGFNGWGNWNCNNGSLWG